MVFTAPAFSPEHDALKRFKQLIFNKLFTSMIASPEEEDM